MQISIANAILVARLVGKSIVRRGLKMWLDFKKSNIIGCELVVDGDFLLTGTQAASVTGDYWQTGSAWTIGSGSAHYDGTSNGSELRQYPISPSLSAGTTLLLSFTISNVQAGKTAFFKIEVSGAPIIVFGYTNFNEGFYKFTYTLSGSQDRILIVPLTTGTGGKFSISDVTTKQVAQFAPDESNNCNEAELYTGKALSFNGLTNKVDFTSVSLSGEFTIAVWFKVGGGVEHWIGNDADGISNSYFNGGNSLIFKINNSTATFSFPSFTGTYSRLVVARDSSDNVRAYVNDKESTSGSFVKSGVFKFDTLGRERTSYGDIILSDFQYYTAKWDKDDVTFDYANPNKLVFNNSASSISVSNLKGYYALSEGSGSIAYDSARPLGSDVINLDFQSNWAAISGAVIDSQYTFSTVGTGGQIRIDSILTQGSLYQVNISGTTTAALLRFRSYSGNDTYFSHSGGGSFSDSFIITSEDLGVRFRSNNSSVTTLTTLTLREVSAGTITAATYVPRQTTIPQLGMVDWAKSTSDGTNEITLIQNPNELGKDILGNTLRLRDGGFNLDGSGYAEVADDSTIQVGNTLSLGFWVKPVITSNSAQNLIYKDSWFNGYGVYLINDNKIRLYLDGTNDTSVMTLTIGSWNYVSITYDGSSIKFYLNGSINGSPIAKTATVDSSGHNLFIGCNENLGENYEGVIDSILVYDETLTPTEVLNNYKIGLPKHSAGLLDSYSGAAAGYSLRRLRAAYSGNCIKVRRASDNAEQDIGFVNNVLNTASLSSFCSGTDGFVTTWYDQSGNRKDITNTTAAQQPQIVTSGSVNTDNGLTYAHYNGNQTDGLFNSSPGLTSTQGSVFMTYNSNDTSNGMLINGSSEFIGAIQNGSSSSPDSGSGTPSYYQNGSPITATRSSLYTNYRKDKDVLASVLSVDFTSWNDIHPYTYDPNSFSAVVKAKEFIIYNSDQTRDKAGIEANIINYYSIT